MAVNEIFEKMATVGLQANMILYLTERYHLSSALASVVLCIWNPLTAFSGGKQSRKFRS
jgi:solute carrier family 15 (peptide/histidine transporter), member 3/4